MGYRAINREAIRLSRTAETHKAEKLFRYNAAHYPSSMTINNLAWFCIWNIRNMMRTL